MSFCLFIAQLIAMLILSGVVTAVPLLGVLRLHDWWAGRRIDR